MVQGTSAELCFKIKNKKQLTILRRFGIINLAAKNGEDKPWKRLKKIKKVVDRFDTMWYYLEVVAENGSNKNEPWK